MNAAPAGIRLKKKAGVLELTYNEGRLYELPAEFLRVLSPSAEVKGHGKGQEVLQSGKRHVLMTDIEAIGQYAIRLTFDDGHDSGIYSWDYLYELCTRHEVLWQSYLDRLQDAGASRNPLPAQTQVINIMNFSATDPDPDRNSG